MPKPKADYEWITTFEWYKGEPPPVDKSIRALLDDKSAPKNVSMNQVVISDECLKQLLEDNAQT